MRGSPVGGLRAGLLDLQSSIAMRRLPCWASGPAQSKPETQQAGARGREEASIPGTPEKGGSLAESQVIRKYGVLD